MVLFALEKLYCFMMSHLLIIDLSDCAVGVLFRKCLLLVCSELFPSFFSIRFGVSCSMWRALIHLELSFFFFFIMISMDLLAFFFISIWSQPV